jgi:hypothetical protein
MDDDDARHISREGLAALEAERVRHRSRVTHRRRDETCVWAPPLGFAAAALDEKRLSALHGKQHISALDSRRAAM